MQIARASFCLELKRAIGWHIDRDIPAASIKEVVPVWSERAGEPDIAAACMQAALPAEFDLLYLDIARAR